MKSKSLIIISLAFLVVVCGGRAYGQNEMTAEQYKARYATLVKNLGSTGVGIETLIQRWESAYPEDTEALEAKFSYYLEKSRTAQLVRKDQDTYLGAKPTLTLADSLGAPVNYFEEYIYDDELFGESVKAMEKAISIAPARLDYRFYKITALSVYEKESPDMTVSELRALIDYNYTQKPRWEYPGVDSVDDEFFSAAIQEYCVEFFKTASPFTYTAFKTISDKMLSYNSSNTLFMDNIGSYLSSAQGDQKGALKQFAKVLKIKPSDQTAIKNCIVISRKEGNSKNEKKYLAMMVKYAEKESDRTSAQARLDFLNGKK